MSEASAVALDAVADINPTAVAKNEKLGELTYIDIASVRSDFGGIDAAAVKTLDWADAPSRAQRRVAAGDILIATVRPYLKACAVVPAEFDGAVASTGFAVMRPRDRADAGYLWALVRSGPFLRHLTARQTGSNYPAVRPKDVAEYLAAWPEEARRREFGDLLAIAERAERASAKLTEAAHVVLEEALEAAAGDAPVEPLGTVLYRIEGGRSPRCPDRPPAVGEHGVLKTSAVRPYVFDAMEAKALDGAAGFHAPAQLREGDLLMLRASGNRHRVGQACVVDADYPHLMMSDLIYRLCVDRQKVMPEYLALVLHTRPVRHQVLTTAVGSSTMRKLNHSLIKQLRVPLLDMDAQRALVVTAKTAQRALLAASEIQHRLGAVAQAFADAASAEFFGGESVLETSVAA